MSDRTHQGRNSTLQSLPHATQHPHEAQASRNDGIYPNINTSRIPGMIRGFVVQSDRPINVGTQKANYV